MFPTVVDHINRAQEIAKSRLEETNDREAKRCYALANTKLEEAQMYYTRGRAIDRNMFNPVDLDKEENALGEPA